MDRFLRRALAGTSLLVLATTVSAQDQASGGSTTLDGITVNGGSGGVIQADGYVGKSSATGAKTDTPFTRTPQSISTVTEAQLKDRNPQTLLDAIAYTPGTRVGAYGFDPRFDSFTVRGFDVTYTGVFRDNLRQPGAGSSLFKTEPYGLEGVSILRGPSSALYGASGAGGLYNLISKRPTEEALREVETQYGSHGRKQAQFDFSGQAAPDSPFSYRLTGLLRDADTEQPGVADDRAYIAPAFTYKPDEDTRFTVLSEYSRTRTGGTAAYYSDPVSGVTDIFGGNPAFNRSVQTQGRVGYEFEHRLNDVFTFRQNARVSRLDTDADWAFAYQPNDSNPRYLDSSAGSFSEQLTAWSVDNQLQAEFDTGRLGHTVLGGVDITRVNWRSLNGYGTAPGLDTLNPNAGRPMAPIAFQTRTDQDQTMTGIYLQDQVRLDDLTVTLGGRRDWVSTDTDNLDLTGGSATTDSQRDSAFTWRAGATYETAWGIAPYASYSTAFSPNAGINQETGSAFKPTESRQQEIGVKYLVPGSNTLLTAALFNIDQDNGLYYEVVNLPTGPANIQVQRGKLRSRGLELEASTSLDNGLSLTAAYTYTKAEIVEGPAGTVGNDVSSIPRHMATLWTHYDIPEDTALAGLGLGVGLRFSGKSYGSDLNTTENAARTFVDASIDYDLGAINKEYKGLALQLNATNLFDKRDPVCSAGFCYKDQGRSVIGSLKYTW